MKERAIKEGWDDWEGLRTINLFRSAKVMRVVWGHQCQILWSLGRREISDGTTDKDSWLMRASKALKSPARSQPIGGGVWLEAGKINPPPTSLPYRLLLILFLLIKHTLSLSLLSSDKNILIFTSGISFFGICFY